MGWRENAETKTPRWTEEGDLVTLLFLDDGKEVTFLAGGNEIEGAKFRVKVLDSGPDPHLNGRDCEWMCFKTNLLRELGKLGDLKGRTFDVRLASLKEDGKPLDWNVEEAKS